MDIVLGVGIPVAILVAIVLGYHIYKWMRNTLEGGLLAGTLYAAMTHHTRKQKLNAHLAETGEILSKVEFSPEALESKRVPETVATSNKAVRNAEEALRKASNAYNAASTAARNLRKSKATKGGPITIEIQQAEENAERAVTKATRAYITASEAKTRASTLHRKAQNNEDLLQEEYARQEKLRKGFRDEEKEEEVLYNPEEVFLRKSNRKSNRKDNRKQKQNRI
jgi:hypothetical protein